MMPALQAAQPTFTACIATTIAAATFTAMFHLATE